MNNTIYRKSNLELYRIICMFMIVCHHYVVNSGLIDSMSINPTSVPSIFYYLFGMWGKTGINCFILITGFFMCKKSISLKKFLKLYLWIIFYMVFFSIVFTITGKMNFSIKEFIGGFLPFRHVVSDNFPQAFLVWWLFIPFLNAIVNNISKVQHTTLMVLSLVVFSGYQILPTTEIALNPICWFSTLYFIASFIRLYPESIVKNNSAKIWGIITLVCVLCAMCTVVYQLFLQPEWPYRYVSGYHTPFAVLVAVTSFLFFKNLNIKYNKIINMGGATSFGVLLIHANSDIMRRWLWGDIVGCVRHYDVAYYVLYAVSSCLCIYFVCSVIDYFRLRYIEPYYMKIANKIISKF